MANVGLLNLMFRSNDTSYLIKNPQITFFKAVYMHYTNFSIQSFKIDFDVDVEFGKTSNISTFPKIGDLISKMYIQFVLPKINISSIYCKLYANNECGLDTLYRNIQNMYYVYNTLVEFAILMKNIRDLLYDYLEAQNTVYDEALLKNIIDENINANLEIYNKAKLIFQLNLDGCDPWIYDFSDIDISNFIMISENSIPLNQQKENVKIQLDRVIKNNKTVIQLAVDKLKCLKIKYIKNTTKYVKQFYVENLGTSLIDHIDFYIGGNRIDRQDGDWLLIWNLVTLKKKLYKTFFDLVGGNESIEPICIHREYYIPEQIVYVPLQFYFCRDYVQSLPVCNITSDIGIELKLNKFCDILCSKICKDIQYDNFFSSKLQAYIYVDYIFLDRSEKFRLQQATIPLDYVIDQLQLLEVKNIELNQQKVSLQLSDTFSHASKELVWLLYSSYDDVSILSKNTSITFNSSDKLIADIGSEKYLKYIQKYKYHQSCPNLNIYSYSFSLYPELYQVSGSANMSEIPSVRFNTELEFISEDDNCGDCCENMGTLKLYSRSINILRIYKGHGNLLFNL